MFFRVLGSVEAERDGTPVDLGAPGERFVLAVLLLEAGRIVPVDRLIELVWPGEPPRSARTGLQVRVSRLRRALGADAVLRTDGEGYVLDVDREDVDAHRFRRLVAEAAACEDADGVATSLRSALDLWRGPALGGVADEQVRHRLTRGLEEARLGAIERLAEAELRRGRHDAVLDELHRMVAEHPERERSVELLVRAQHAGGQTERALDVLRGHSRRLADEFGLDPGPRIRDLEQSLLRGELADPVGSDAARPARPAQLPVAPAGFRGRGDELAALDVLAAEVRPPETAVLLVTGMPGVGKTGLALSWGHRQAERFPDGQLFADLRGHAAEPAVVPREVLGGFLRALGVDPSLIPADLDQAAAMYRSRLAGRRLLVVLDNAGSADQVRPLLPGTAGCLVLVTSRQRLDGLVAHEGARRLPLRPLDPGAAAEVLASAGVRGAAPGLVDLCGGLPLALRIAAANVAADPFPAADYAGRPRSADRLGRLSLDDGEDAAVRVAFDVSYLRLDAAGRRAFRAFGLAPGPDVTVPALAALLDVSAADAAAAVRTLLRAHLVDQHRPHRFRCHDLLRDYATERAQADESAAERDAARRRLFDYYVHAAAAAVDTVFPDRAALPAPEYRPEYVDRFDRPEDAVAWLDAAQDNLVAAVLDAAKHGPARSAWELSDVLRPYFLLGRDVVSWQEVAAAADAATANQTAGVPAPARASALLTLAELAFRNSDHDLALDRFEAALHLSEQGGWTTGRIDALNRLGATRSRQGRHEDALRYRWQARRLAVEAGADALAACALSAIGAERIQGSSLDEARTTLVEGAGELQRAGAVATHAVSLNALAIVLIELDRFDDARAVLGEAMELSVRSGRRAAALQIKNNLADLDLHVGRYEEALVLASEVAREAPELGRDLAEPTARITMAEAYRGLGRLDDAAASARLALDQAVVRRLPGCEWGALHELALIQLAVGNVETARLRAEESLGLARTLGYRGYELKTMRTLELIEQAAGTGT